MTQLPVLYLCPSLTITYEWQRRSGSSKAKVLSIASLMSRSKASKEASFVEIPCDSLKLRIDELL